MLLRRNVVAFNKLVDGQVVVAYQGLKFVINQDSGLGPLFIKYYEPLAFKALASTEGRIFVDIGANVGGYSLRMASIYERVVAVEPGHVAASILRENIVINEIKNVEVLERAVSSAPMSTRLYRTGEIATWTIEPTGGDYVDVPTISLEGIIRGLGKIDAMKVDAEGAELQILESSGGVLNWVGNIVIEARLENASRIRSLLTANGFRTEDLDAEGGIILVHGEQKS